ncbi:DUF1543 domain-containing protein [Mucilaginibacter sp. UR6-11]|uniref:DUF1543 domain-containing protein n=1 Tax=Mucilaginibacter sp. UR6-11 TaxID=1435644 RepID=UPI001E4D1E47|nr:DUF1543 domain-containing protein [Mucilaginibacter sp. UR6-11]MCC8424770.1 DUF1543 domain-containing protein [Mucilaginibacter sp. UR6-11]
MTEPAEAPLKLYMLLLGSKAPGRHTEQHDFFFGIAASLKELVPAIKVFWRGAVGNLHIDGWREVNTVDGYNIKVILKEGAATPSPDKLFFINLGGYIAGRLEEQHYVILSVKPDRTQAIQNAKKAAFFKTNTITTVKGANAHIDDKYGLDVDDIYKIEEMLPPAQKAQYHLEITPGCDLPEDEVHLGYFRLDRL